MGWYVICSICNQEGQYGPSCDCAQNEIEYNSARMKEALITHYFYVAEYSDICMICTLRAPNGSIFYLNICLADYGDQFTCWRKVMEIPKKKVDALYEMKIKQENQTETTWYTRRLVGSISQLYFSQLPKELLLELEKYSHEKITFVFAPINNEYLLVLESLY